MEHFPPSGTAGGYPRVEESGDMMPVAGVCLSQARVLSGFGDVQWPYKSQVTRLQS